MTEPVPTNDSAALTKHVETRHARQRERSPIWAALAARWSSFTPPTPMRPPGFPIGVSGVDATFFATMDDANDHWRE